MPRKRTKAGKKGTHVTTPLSHETSEKTQTMDITRSPRSSHGSGYALRSRESTAPELPRSTEPQGSNDHDYRDLSPVIEKLGGKLGARRLSSFTEDLDDSRDEISLNDGASNVLKTMNSSESDTNGDFTYITLSQKRKRSSRALACSDEENCPEEELANFLKKKKKDNPMLDKLMQGTENLSAVQKSKIFPAPGSELKYVGLRGESLLESSSDCLNASSEVETSRNFGAFNSSALSASTNIDEISKSTSQISSSDDLPEYINIEALDETSFSSEIPEISAADVARVLEQELSLKSMEVDELRVTTRSASLKQFLSPIPKSTEQNQFSITRDVEMAESPNIQRIETSRQTVSKGDSLEELPEFFVYSTEEHKGWDSDEDLDENEKAAKAAKAARAAKTAATVRAAKAAEAERAARFAKIAAAAKASEAAKAAEAVKAAEIARNAAAMRAATTAAVVKAAKNAAIAQAVKNSMPGPSTLRGPLHNESGIGDLSSFFVPGMNHSKDLVSESSVVTPRNTNGNVWQGNNAAGGANPVFMNANPPRNMLSSDEDMSSDYDDSDYDIFEDGQYLETADWHSPYNRKQWRPRRGWNRNGRPARGRRAAADDDDDNSYLFSRMPRSKNNAKNGDVTRDEARVTIETLHELSTCVQMRPSSNVLAKDPANLNVKLLPHQQHALAWMMWREQSIPAGGILADDMGLGKTLTAIALIMKSLEQEKHAVRILNGKARNEYNLGGTLIISPANLILQWYHEINRRTKIGSEVRNINIYHQRKERRLEVLASYTVVITSYDTLMNNFDDNKILFRIHWKRVILDEAHAVRNPATKRSKCLISLATEKRWALTGTPIHNKTKDVFPLIRFLKMRPFNEPRAFTRWIDNRDIAGEQRLRFVMDSIMLRRTKVTLIADGLMLDLPLKTKREIEIALVLEERSVYDKVMTFSQTLFMQFLHQRLERERQRTEGAAYRRNDDYCTVQLNARQQRFLAQRGPIQHHHILTLILRLRQICCHPALIRKMLEKDDFCDAGLDEKKVDEKLIDQANNLLSGEALFGEMDDEEANQEIGVDESIIAKETLTIDNPVFNKHRKSSKMEAVLEKVHEIVVEKNEKVIIVSDWVGYLDLIGHHLNAIPGATYCSYTGSTKYNDRDNIVTCFNTKKNPMVLLLSLRAGGQGLNLMAANHVILVDIHWNPQLEVQAQDRVWRIGQTKDVFIHKLICVDTIEERIIALQNKKLQIADNVLAGVGRDDRLGIAELRTLFNV